jgi:hypothetical protein
MVLQLRARLGTNAYRTITYRLRTNPNYNPDPAAFRVPQYRLVREVTAPHGSSGIGIPATPPPGGGAWPDWSVPFSGAYLDDAHVRPVNIPAKTLMFPPGADMYTGTANFVAPGTDLSNVMHLNIRLIPDEIAADDDLIIDVDTAVIRFFSTTTSLQRVPS